MRQRRRPRTSTCCGGCDSSWRCRTALDSWSTCKASRRERHTQRKSAFKRPSFLPSFLPSFGFSAVCRYVTFQMLSFLIPSRFPDEGKSPSLSSVPLSSLANTSKHCKADGSRENRMSSPNVERIVCKTLHVWRSSAQRSKKFLVSEGVSLVASQRGREVQHGERLAVQFEVPVRLLL